MQTVSSKPRGSTEASFAAQLSAAMNNHRMTPNELAERVNISGSATRAYLAGKFLPRPPVLRSLEEVLGVRFVMDDPSATKPQKVTNLNGTAKATPSATGVLTDAPVQPPLQLTITQAKQALARTLGVSESQIEISVRA